MKKTIAICAVALLAACCGPNKIDATAERARFDAIAPEYMELTEGAFRADGSRWFDKSQVENRKRTVSEWEAYVLDVEASK